MISVYIVSVTYTARLNSVFKALVKELNALYMKKKQILISIFLTIFSMNLSLNAQIETKNNEKFNSPDLRIIGGEPVNPGEYPWIATLGMSNGFPGCAASLIAPQWALTAGHCITNELPIPGIPIVESVIINTLITDIGALEAYSELISVEDIIVHQDYSGILEGATGPDIALIRLNEPAITEPVQLAQYSDANLYAHQMPAKVMGWGITEVGGTMVDSLRVANCSIIDTDSCAVMYEASNYPVNAHDANSEGNICAGFFNGSTPEGAAQGDSGGPLIIDDNGTYKQVGIVSGGETNITTELFPGVFTFVPKYYNWIDSIITNYSPLTGIKESYNENISIVHQGDYLFFLGGLEGDSHYQINIFNSIGQLIHTNLLKSGDSKFQINSTSKMERILLFQVIDLEEGLMYSKKILINSNY